MAGLAEDSRNVTLKVACIVLACQHLLNHSVFEQSDAGIILYTLWRRRKTDETKQGVASSSREVGSDQSDLRVNILRNCNAGGNKQILRAIKKDAHAHANGLILSIKADLRENDLRKYSFFSERSVPLQTQIPKRKTQRIWHVSDADACALVTLGSSKQWRVFQT